MHYGDAIRILGTIAVVLGHCADMPFFSSPPLGRTWWVCNVVDAAMRWAVPAYIMLSGALLLDPARAETPTRFYKKRLARIGVPLVFWSGIFMWFAVDFLGQYTGTTWHEEWVLLLKGEPYVHLHFIFRIAGLYAFTPVLRVVLKQLPRPMLVSTICIMLGLSMANSIADSITGTELSAFARFVPFLGYYLSGYLLRDWVVTRRGMVWASVGYVSAVAMLAGGTGLLVHRFGMQSPPPWGLLLYDFLNPTRVLMAFCTWAILLKAFHNPFPTSAAGRKWVRRWADTTLGLYLIHPLFRDMFYYGWFGPWRLPHSVEASWPNVWVGLPLSTIAVYVPSLIATIIIMRVPVIRRITG